jgi:cytochrome c553
VSHASQCAPANRGPMAWNPVGSACDYALIVGKGFFRAEREFRASGSHPFRRGLDRRNPAIISRGDAFRGLLLARRCNHCHGEEGFSSVPGFPNLAGEDRLSFWKQMQDFRSGKRTSPVMQGIAEGFSARDAADLAAYYAMLPTASDPQDNRSFPQSMPTPRVPRWPSASLFSEMGSAAYRPASHATVR